jgi:hypothetical protein
MMEHTLTFVKTDWTFGIVADWMTGLKRQDNLKLTQSSEVTLDFIRGNDENDNQKWVRLYDFSRTASVTLRYMMLKGAKLLHLHDPKPKDTARQRNMAALTFGRDWHRPGVGDIPLATDEYQAQWISAHFDMLLPQFYLQCELNNIEPGHHDIRSFTRELVVVNTNRHTTWHIIAALQVERLDSPEGFQLQAVPLVTVNRYDCKHAPKYPFLPQDPPLDLSKEMDDLTKGIAALQS